MTNGMRDDEYHFKAPGNIEELWRWLLIEQRATREWRHTINSQLDKIDADVSRDYIRRDYFEAVFHPVRNIVYGGVAGVLTTVMGAILYLVVRSAP